MTPDNAAITLSRPISAVSRYVSATTLHKIMGSGERNGVLQGQAPGGPFLQEAEVLLFSGFIRIFKSMIKFVQIRGIFPQTYNTYYGLWYKVSGSYRRTKFLSIKIY